MQVAFLGDVCWWPAGSCNIIMQGASRVTTQVSHFGFSFAAPHLLGPPADMWHRRGPMLKAFLARAPGHLPPESQGWIIRVCRNCLLDAFGFWWNTESRSQARRIRIRCDHILNRHKGIPLQAFTPQQPCQNHVPLHSRRVTSQWPWPGI